MKPLVKITAFLFALFLMTLSLMSNPVSYMPQNVLYASRDISWNGSVIAQQVYVAGRLDYSNPKCLKIRGGAFICLFHTMYSTTCRVSKIEIVCWTNLHQRRLR